VLAEQAGGAKAQFIERETIQMQTKQSTRKLLALFLSLAMVFSMAAALGGTASAAPVSIGADTHITAGGSYQLDPGAINGVIYLETSDAVTLVGNGALSTSTPNTALTIDAKVAGTAPNTGANLTLQDVYVSSPYSGGNIIDFRGTGNTLNSTSANILESSVYGSQAVIHAGLGTELTINGSPAGAIPSGPNFGLYVYKSTSAAGIGGNTSEASGTITFASGSVFVKGSQTGASIGGDSTTDTNGDITISGGLLCVQTNARGAGIGASNQGQCAGDVYITGGSTLINVEFSGSAIGRGDSGTTTGNLFISGGSLKVVVDPNAGGNWPGGAGVNNSAITATINYGTPVNPQHGNVAEVSVSSLDISDNLTAVFNPDGQSPAVVYDQVGLNQYNYTANQTYTPGNWAIDAANTNLYLYGPEGTTGYIAVSDSTATQNYSYDSSTHTLSSYFALTPVKDEIVSFFADNATVTVGTAQVNYATVAPNGSLTFTVTANSGFTVTGVSDNGVSIGTAAGTYTLSNVTTNHRIVVTTSPQVTYNVAFTAPNATVYVNGIAVTSATINAGGTLDFTVVPDTGYDIVGTPTASNGTVTGSGGSYTLSSVTANTTVTITTAQIYTVSFAGGNDQARVNGVSTTSITVDAGGDLRFTVVPDLGYTVTNVTANGVSMVPDPQGNYSLTNIQTDYSIVVTTQASAGFWTNSVPGAWGGSGTSADPYTISTGASLAALLQNVNGGQTYSGIYFKLANNIDLSGMNWSPIGGGRDLDLNNIPITNTNYFAGYLDGDGNTISGMSLTVGTANAGSGAYGLFGYVNGGSISDLSVAGSVTTSAGINDVGGVVGFLDGDIDNVVNLAAVTADDNTNTGGIAGFAYYGGADSATIQNSANLAVITGRSRLGGIAGEISGVTVDQSFNSGAINAVAVRTGTTFVGGVVGYAAGAIQNSYNTGDVTASSSLDVNFRVGGIAGILNGTAGLPIGSLTDVYNTGSVTAPAGRPVVEPLYGDADGNSGVVITDSVYLNTLTQDQLGATWNNVNGVTQAFLQSQAVVAGAPYLDPHFFAQYSADYPVLNWQTVTVSSGVQSDFTAALNALNGGKSVILISALPVNIPSNTTTIDIGGINGKIYRAPGYRGDLFSVTGTGLLNFQSGTIDGNAAGSTSVTGSLVSISSSSAQLTIGPGATLKNNTTDSNGAAVFVNVGILSMTGGTITNNTTTGNGGAVYLGSNVGFTMTGGEISGNTAALGNGIYVTASGTLALSPSGADAITFGALNNIYLSGGVSFIIGADLGEGVNGTIGLTFGSPNEGDLVATASNQTMAESSVVKLVPAGTVILDVDGSDILIAGTR
jgi:hypothetical protein